MVKAAGMHYTSGDGRQILDGTADSRCVNAGHAHPAITKAISEQAATMDFAPPFQMSHPKAFEAASSFAAMAPAGLEALRKAIHHHLPVPTFRLMSSRKAPVMVSAWALGEWIEKVEEDAKAVWERGQI